MVPEAIIGRLQVLNVGDGDTEFHFDPEKPDDVERTKRVIQQMFKAGYLLFVRLDDGTLKRVRRFDAKHCTYVIEDSHEDTQADHVGAKDSKPGKAAAVGAKGRRKTRALPARRHRAFGVARTAGG